jgi:hypothetical protein
MTRPAGPDWQDDPSVLPHHVLWRRIPGWHFVWDANRNAVRPSSAAFDNDSDGSPMSIQLAAVLAEYGRGELEVLQGHTGFALARFLAEAARNCGQMIVPEPGPGDPAHGLVVGDKPPSVRKKLQRASEWQTEPPAMHLGDKVLLLQDRSGAPCVRLPHGKCIPATEFAPHASGLAAAQAWLASPESGQAILRDTVEKAVAIWTGTRATGF